MKINDSGVMPNTVREEGVNKDGLEDCKRFFALAKPIKMPLGTHQGWFSYGLKHVIEYWVGHYVSNGSCIQAALDMGFPVLQLTDRTGGSLNAQIGISKKEVKRICREEINNPNNKMQEHGISALRNMIGLKEKVESKKERFARYNMELGR